MNPSHPPASHEHEHELDEKADGRPAERSVVERPAVEGPTPGQAPGDSGVGDHRALVVGASGLVGRRLAEHLLACGWSVHGLARRAPPPEETPFPFSTADLCDREAVRAAVAPLRVTHLFHAARYDHPEGTPEAVQTNTAMLRHVLDAAVAGGTLRHVHAVHGTKYYGHQLAPVALPLTEQSPRAPGGSFYFDQEDLLARRAPAEGWTWTTSRPHAFSDPAIDRPRSLGLVFAVFAAIRRELGEPLCFPGTPAAAASRTQFTDGRLLARAIGWMVRDPACANQAFNVVNGDNPTWNALFDAFGHHLGMATGPALSIRLTDYMVDKAAVWDRIVQRHGLRPTRLADVALWAYGDIQPRPEWDVYSSMDRARSLGFLDRVDSTAMFLAQFDHYRHARLVP